MITLFLACFDETVLPLLALQMKPNHSLVTFSLDSTATGKAFRCMDDLCVTCLTGF